MNLQDILEQAFSGSLQRSISVVLEILLIIITIKLSTTTFIKLLRLKEYLVIGSILLGLWLVIFIYASLSLYAHIYGGHSVAVIRTLLVNIVFTGLSLYGLNKTK